MRNRRLVLLCLAFSIAISPRSMGEEPSAPSGDDTQPIAEAIASYVEAFNARDVKRLVAHWSPEGVYISMTTGEAIVGHEAMTAEFSAILGNADAPKLVVATKSIEFISPNVALERGVATVTRGPDDMVETHYQAVLVNHGGKWLLDRVSEDEMPEPNPLYEKLKVLEPFLGDWISEGDGVVVELSCNWTKNQNFISRTFKATVDGEVESSGLQIIAWDAKKKQITSWLFDSDGSVVTGSWSDHKDHWAVQSVATFKNGGVGSATSIMKPVGENAFEWQKVNRVLDGELLPNTEKIVFQRK